MKNRKQISMDAFKTQSLSPVQLKQIKGGTDDSSSTDGSNFIGTTDIIQL